MTSLRVLLIEGDSADAEVLSQQLGALPGEWVVEHATRLSEALQRLGVSSYDLMVLDLDLLDAEGLDALHQLRGAVPDVPIVVLTDDEHLAVKALREGAQDYLVKSRADDVSIRRSVRYALERKGTELALHQSNELYGLVVKHSHDLIVTVDLDGTLTYVSPSMQRMLGYAPEELVGRPVHELLHPDDLEQSRARFGAAAAGRVQTTANVRLRHRSGHWREFEGLTAPILDASGAPRMLLAIGRDVTERHQALRALGEAEAKYRTLVEQIPAVTYVNGADNLGALYVSPQIQSLLGYAPDEWLADPDFSYRILHEEDVEAVRRAAGRCVESGEPFAMDYRLHRADGRVIWVHDETTLVRGDSGEPLFWQGVMIDITRQKQTELELRESEGRFRAIFDGALDTVLLINDVGVLVDVNPAGCALFGMPRSQIVGSSAKDYSRDEKAFLGLLSRLMDADRERGEHELIVGGGRELVVEFSARVNVLPGLHLVIMRDVTHEKRMKAALRESEERFRSVVQNMIDPLAILTAVRDEHGAIVDFHLEYLNLAGKQALLTSPVGDRLLETHGPEPFDSVISGVSTALGHNSLVRPFEEYCAVAELGKHLSLDAVPFVIPGEAHEASVGYVDVRASKLGDGLVVSWRDVTERMRSGEEARRSVTELQRLHAERERLLAHMVRAQEEERRAIAADIHDDSIQKMVAVAMRLDLLRQDHRELEDDEMFVRLSDSVRLSIDRLRSLMFELRPYALDRDGLVAALRQYVDEQSKLPDAPVYEVEEHLTNEPPQEERVILYRVAQEALTNVRKHARASHVRVTIESAEGTFLLRIEDDGVGFDREVDDTDQPGHIGLVSMRERIELAGGGLSIRSGRDEGTVVEFWLPGRAERLEAAG